MLQGRPGIGRTLSIPRSRTHPYHGTTRNRCADRRFPRSRPTVGAEVIGSLAAKLCALLRAWCWSSPKQAILRAGVLEPRHLPQLVGEMRPVCRCGGRDDESPGRSWVRRLPLAIMEEPGGAVREGWGRAKSTTAMREEVRTADVSGPRSPDEAVRPPWSTTGQIGLSAHQGLHKPQHHLPQQVAVGCLQVLAQPAHQVHGRCDHRDPPSRLPRTESREDDAVVLIVVGPSGPLRPLLHHVHGR
jgi:hypothetical protein